MSREFAHRILCLFEANFSGNSEGFPDGGGEGVFSTMGGGPSGVFEHHPDTAVPPSRITTEFKLGGDPSVAAGPVGVGSSSAVTADVVSFAKSKGLFAGLNLEGSMVKVSDDSNKAYYNKAVSPVDIIVKKAATNPGSAKLREELKKAAK